MLRRHPGFVAFATAALALPIGATLAVFTIVNALWLRPLPFPEPERVVVLVGEDGPGATDSLLFVNLETSDAWDTFEAAAGQVATSGALASLRPRIVLEQVGRELETLGVTSQYFRTLGVPVLGRDFTRDDNRYGAEPVAIMSHLLWTRAFGARPEIVGSVIPARPGPLRVIGVAPAGFAGARRGERVDLWIPSNLVPRVAPAGNVPEHGIPLLVVARLRPGQHAEDARRVLVEALGAKDGAATAGMRLVPLARVFGTPETPTIVVAEGRAAGVVGGLAALVLIAAAVTLMTLVLVHYERRRHEFGVRIALGASRARLLRDLAGELAWLAATGLPLALAVAFWSLRTLPALSLPGGVNLGRLDLSIDWRVLFVAIGAAIATLVLASLLPLSRSTRGRLAGELFGSNLTSPATSQRLRQVLLCAHVAATTIVLVAAGLFVRAVVHGFSMGAGFDVDRTLFVQAQLLPPFVESLAELDAQTALARSRSSRLEEELRSLPGLQALARGRPPIGPDASRLIRPRRFEVDGDHHDLEVGVLSGDPELLTALGVPILQGRQLTAADSGVQPRPVILTASLARALWPDSSPIGRVFGQFSRNRRFTSVVAGVAADFAYGSTTAPPAGVLVVADRPLTDRGEQAFVLRAERPDLLAPSIRRLMRRIVPEAPRLTIATGREVVANDLGRQRLGAWFFSGFGLIALALGAGSVFGLVAYLAESRRREFGVRVALGAAPRDLLLRAAAAGLTPVSAGAAAGLFAATLSSRVLVSLLPGLSPLDPVTYASVGVLVIAVAAVAALGAAGRLRRVEPAEALRAE